MDPGRTLALLPTVIPVGMKAYFSYVNARRDAKTKKRGILGRQIVWKYYDDGYNPANTAQQTRKLVEEDKVFALFGGLGTEPQQAVEKYLNDPTEAVGSRSK